MIHPSALVSPKARIGANVTIGPFSIVHDNVTLGQDSTIGAYCEIGLPTKLAPGEPLEIGMGALIRSHSVFYAGSSFGENLVTGHRVTVREHTRAGRNLQIGTMGDVQGECTLGDYVRMQSNVLIAQLSKIGNYVWIFPSVVFTNDPRPPSEHFVGVTVEDFAVIATQAVLLPGITVGRGAIVGALSVVNRDVPPDTVVAGEHAKPVCKTTDLRMKDGSGRIAYPWRRHFHRGYPAEAIAEWMKEFEGKESER